jgi:archaemetzincin
MIIEIIPMGKILDRVLKDLKQKLKQTYEPFVKDCQVSEGFEVPAAAYDPPRKQYRSDIILDSIRRRIVGDRKALALVNVDLYVPPLNFVFGQAQCPGEAAVISLCRLDPSFYGRHSNYELFIERAVKEAIHELGHTFGLTHCSSPTCVMSFSNSILEVDQKSPNFCPTCRKRLGG